MFEHVSNNLQAIHNELKGAKLVAVSKYTDLESIKAAYDWGQRDFGENKVQDLSEKSTKLSADINWHFIGKLQSNKINSLLQVTGLKYIHSIDSLKLLEALISRIEKFEGESLNLFLQMNTSGEEEKSGFLDYSSLLEAANLLKNYSSNKLKLYGLMTMGRIRTEEFETDAQSSFKKLIEYKDRLEKDLELNNLKLSMGMSRDYKLALENGSDYIRVGSSIFQRNS